MVTPISIFAHRFHWVPGHLPAPGALLCALHLRRLGLPKGWAKQRSWRTLKLVNSMIFFDILWFFNDILWFSMFFFLRSSMIFYVFLRYSMIFYDLLWPSMIFYDILWSFMIFFDLPWYSLVYGETAKAWTKYSGWLVIIGTCSSWFRGDCDTP